MSNSVSTSFVTTPFRINGFKKLIGGGVTIYGKEYTIRNLTVAQSAIEGLTGYWVYIAGNDKEFHLNVNFPKGKVELWEVGSPLEEVGTDIHKKDFKDIPAFLNLTKYLLLKYDDINHPTNPF